MKICVFAVNDTYQIMVWEERKSLMWVKVGEKYYYDAFNGVLRSENPVHRMIVPKEELERERKYTIFERVLVRERKAYFTKTEEVCEYESDFYPVKKTGARAYHIADAHNLTEEPLKAAKVYGKIDFLILNGDISNDSSKKENLEVIHQIGWELTKGKIPIIFARGNHDLRGILAEKLYEYTPTDKGKSYYTFRLGSIWGMVLDCGEDKEDNHPEYGNTICCHEYREEQTAFIKKVIKNASREYLQEGVKNRLIIVHNPFTQYVISPFDIERELYQEWAGLLKCCVKPDLMLCGHLHEHYVSYPLDGKDAYGNPSPVVVGAEVEVNQKYFVGAGLEFGEKEITLQFTSSLENTLEKYVFSKEEKLYENEKRNCV